MQITVEESINLAREQSYWDGYAAGAQSAATHAKDLALHKVIAAQKPMPPPAQPEPAKQPTEE